MLRRRSDEPSAPVPAAASPGAGDAAAQVAASAQASASKVEPIRAWAANLAPRWRAPVAQAIRTHDRFGALVAPVPPGPTRDRLEGIRPVLDEAVQRVANTVFRAMNAEAIANGLDTDAATAELKGARRQLEQARAAAPAADHSALDERVRMLAARHRAVNDAVNLAEDTTSQLEALNVRLDTAVTHASTVVLRTQLDRYDDIDGPGGLDANLDRELDDVIDSLAGLDAALRDLPG